MHSKSGKKCFIVFLATIAAIISLGTAAWAASPLVFSSSAGQPLGKANNGTFVVSGTIASTSVYTIPGTTSKGIRIQFSVGGGNFNDKDVLTVTSSSNHWQVSFENGGQTAPLTDPTKINLVSDSNEANLPVSEDITIIIRDTKNHSESLTLTVNKVVVNLPVTPANIVMYDGADYSGSDNTQATAKGLTAAFTTGNGKALGTVASGMVFLENGKKLNDEGWVWPGVANVQGKAAKNAAGQDTGMYFYTSNSGLTGGPQDPVSFDVMPPNDNGLLVCGDGNAIVAGVTADKKIASFTVSVLPAVLSLKPSSLDIAVGSNAGKLSPVVARIMGKDISYLKIADADGKNRANNKLMPCGISLSVSGDKTLSPTKEIVLSGVPTSADKGVYSVVAFDDANAIIASADLTVTVGNAAPTSDDYAMKVDNFDAVVSKDVGSMDHTISFTRGGTAVGMPALDSLTFKDLSNPSATPTTVNWNGLTLTANKATGKVTMTGTPQATGSKTFTLHATSQAGTIADWAFSVVVKQSGPRPSGSGSGGCNAGFGLLGLLAACSFVATFGRRK